MSYNFPENLPIERPDYDHIFTMIKKFDGFSTDITDIPTRYTICDTLSYDNEFTLISGSLIYAHDIFVKKSSSYDNIPEFGLSIDHAQTRKWCNIYYGPLIDNAVDILKEHKVSKMAIVTAISFIEIKRIFTSGKEKAVEYILGGSKRGTGKRYEDEACAITRLMVQYGKCTIRDLCTCMIPTEVELDNDSYDTTSISLPDYTETYNAMQMYILLALFLNKHTVFEYGQIELFLPDDHKYDLSSIQCVDAFSDDSAAADGNRFGPVTDDYSHMSFLYLIDRLNAKQIDGPKDEPTDWLPTKARSIFTTIGNEDLHDTIIDLGTSTETLILKTYVRDIIDATDDRIFDTLTSLYDYDGVDAISPTAPADLIISKTIPMKDINISFRGIDEDYIETARIKILDADDKKKLNAFADIIFPNNKNYEIIGIIDWPYNGENIDTDFITCEHIFFHLWLDADNNKIFVPHSMTSKYQLSAVSKDSISSIKKWSEAEMSTPPGLETDLTRLLRLWYGCQIALLHPSIKEVVNENVKVVSHHENKTSDKKKKKNKIRYERVHYIKTESIEHCLQIDKSKRGFSRKCLCWYVIGHWRHYPDKTIWIDGFWKGELRHIKQSDESRERAVTPKDK